MPIAEIMTSDIDLMELGIGLLLTMLALLMVDWSRTSDRLNKMLAPFQLPVPTLVPIPVLTREAERSAALAKAKRRQQFYQD
ncbi:MAG: hypothetical protein HQL93_10320 [Magnetococcales bacterium]|nr:hypothetical protein [Magnetococcales bacterium]